MRHVGGGEARAVTAEDVGERVNDEQANGVGLDELTQLFGVVTEIDD